MASVIVLMQELPVDFMKLHGNSSRGGNCAENRNNCVTGAGRRGMRRKERWEVCWFDFLLLDFT